MKIANLIDVFILEKPNYLIKTLFSVLLITSLISCKLLGQGRINLPQLEKQIAVPDNYHTTLKSFFSAITTDTSIGLNETVEHILLDILPTDYQAGCQEMILHWGTLAEGTAKLAVRVLYKTAMDKDEILEVLLVYRCFSLYEGYLDQFYDERLAVLLIKPTMSFLIMLPHAEDCDNSSELSHISLEQVVQCDANPMVCLRIETSNDNPCCGGPFNYSAEQIRYYIPNSTGVKLVASVLKHQEEYYGDTEGDVEIIYDAKITLHKDPNMNISCIESQYSRIENEKLQETGEITYIWDDEKKEFKPTEK
jgi:hypothetical protein